jgi:hypothetical protein
VELKFCHGNLYILDLKELNEEKPNGIKLLIEENVEVVRDHRCPVPPSWSCGPGCGLL